MSGNEFNKKKISDDFYITSIKLGDKKIFTQYLFDCSIASLMPVWPNICSEKTVDEIFESFFKQGEENKKFLDFAIRNYKDDLCGFIGFYEFNLSGNGTTKVSFWLGEQYRRKGLMTKSLFLLCKFVFGSFDIRRIEALLINYNSNKNAVNVLKNCGFKYEGISGKSVKKENIYYDAERFSIIG